MIQTLLTRVADPSVTGRDLLVDEINDQIEQRDMPESEIVHIVDQLLPALTRDSDPALQESVFNLLRSAFDRVGVLDHALRVIVSLLDELPPGCLIHALPIIADSAAPDRQTLIAPFLKSANPAVRRAAEQCFET